MQNNRLIVNIITRPGLSSSGECILVGLELNDGRVVWSKCLNVSASKTARQTIQQKIAPILQDNSEDSFVDIVAKMDALTEPVVTTRIIQPQPDSSASGVKMSRRRLITGMLTEDKPQTEKVVEERSLPPRLRYGLSQAILKAMSRSQNKTQLAMLLAEYRLPEPETAVPLHVEVNDFNFAIIQPVLETAVASLGYRTEAANQQATLGANAERLQAHVRQVKEWLTIVAGELKPIIHLNLLGGFTELYDNNEGKILGALYGLEQAAKPYRLVVENVVMGEGLAVNQILKTLQSYLQARKIKVKLAAGYSLFSAAELQKFMEETAVQQIHLDMTRFGSIHQNIQFILACKKRGIEVILHEESGAVETAVAVALATGVHSLSGPPDRLYNEMIKVMGSFQNDPLI